MADVFISYGHANIGAAERLAREIASHGISVWYDRNLLPGRRFDFEIEEELAKAGCVIVLWSEDSVASQYVRAEANKGLARGVLIPAFIEQTNLPLAFSLLETLDLQRWLKGEDPTAFNTLLLAIRTYARLGGTEAVPLDTSARKESEDRCRGSSSLGPPSADRAKRRLALVDYALLLTMVPIWLLCLVLHVLDRDYNWGPPLPINTLSAHSPEDYPVVFASRVADLQPFDALIAIAGHDLRGASAARAAALFLHAAHKSERAVTIQFARRGDVRTYTIATPANPLWWRMLPYSVGVVAVGVIILLGAPQWPLSRDIFVTHMAHGLATLPFGGGSVLQSYMSFALFSVMMPLGAALSLRVAARFPAGAHEPLPWQTVCSWVFGVGFACLIALHLVLSLPIHWVVALAGPVSEALIVGYMLSVLWCLTRNYQRADGQGKRQLRWILLGFYVGLIPMVAAVTLEHVGTPSELRPWAFGAAYIALTAVPIGFLVAMFGYRFLDVDPLISAATSYSVLGAVAWASLVFLIPRLTAAVSAAFSVGHSAVELVLSIGMIGMLPPANKYLGRRIDVLFFPERHQLEEGISDLLREIVAHLGSGRELTGLAAQRMVGLFRPRGCVAYVKAGESFEPVFTHGAVMARQFDARGPIVATLRERGRLLVSRHYSQGKRHRYISALEEATLTELGAAIAAPVMRRGEIVAFICFGPKTSRDIFTATDIGFLDAVIVAVGGQLR